MIEMHTQKIAWRVGLLGSVLHAGRSVNDLDIVIYPARVRSGHLINSAELKPVRSILESIGLSRRAGVEAVHEEWRKQGSSDEKYVEVWRYENKKIDIFFMR